MYVRAGRPAFEWPYAVVYKSTSLMSSSLLLQQWPACKLNIIIRVISSHMGPIYIETLYVTKKIFFVYSFVFFTWTFVNYFYY